MCVVGAVWEGAGHGGAAGYKQCCSEPECGFNCCFAGSDAGFPEQSS